MKRQLAILFLLVTSIIASYGQTEKRLALVVGNSKYIGKGNSLRNPVNDATDVALKLKALGFDVDTLLDASLLDTDDAIDDFGRKAKDYDVALFYYSGHGLQSKGNNYMVPVDAELKSEAEVKYKCTPLNMLLDKMDESDCPLKIIVLDACRNNPLTKSWYRGGAEKGLALINPPQGTFITFATAAGSVALDGKDRNSPYTTAFLETLDRPNLDLDKFFSEVGKLVLKETNNEQVPWKSSSAMSGDDFYFNRKVASDASGSQVDSQAVTMTDAQDKRQQDKPAGVSQEDSDKLLNNNYYNKKQYADEKSKAAGQGDENATKKVSELGSQKPPTDHPSSTGVFSVAPDRKVHFAPGNLQYQASTDTWRFAPNPWDVIGKDNENISPSYGGWIDLFGWGTGDNPTKVSEQNNDYRFFNDWGWYFGDGWRTLSSNEWGFVFDNRKTNSGIRYAMAIVNNINGVILLPDDWKKNTFVLRNANQDNANFSSNIISDSIWQNTMAPNGAVFLPAAGCREGTIAYLYGVAGCYWSSSFNKNTSTDNDVYFFNKYLYSKHYFNRRCNGQSVRLVYPTK